MNRHHPDEWTEWAPHLEGTHAPYDYHVARYPGGTEIEIREVPHPSPVPRRIAEQYARELNQQENQK